MYVLLITLIVGVLFTSVFGPGTVRAQFPPYYEVFLDTDDETDLITLLTDTDDFTFTLLLTNFGDTTDTIIFEINITNPAGEYEFLTSPDEGGDSPPTLNKWSVELESFAEEEITLTVPRGMLLETGYYDITVLALSTGDDSSYSDVIVSIKVNAPATKPYEVAIRGETYDISYGPAGLFVDGWPFRMSDTRDAIYILYVENKGSKLDQYFLTVSGELDNATLTPTAILVDPGYDGYVKLTIPRASFSKHGIFDMTVVAESVNDATAIAAFSTKVYVTDDRESTPEPTPPTPNPTPPIPDQSTQKVIFLSEFMFESEDGKDSLPQWIEVYNSGISAVNLNGWKLHWKRLQPSLLEATTTFKEDFIILPQQARLIVTTLGRRSGSSNLSDNAVYQLDVLHAQELAQDDIANHNRLITRGGFSLKLLNSEGVLIDQIGTLSGDEKTWELSESLIDGVRSSLIRRFDESVPRAGIERRGWIRAFDAK